MQDTIALRVLPRDNDSPRNIVNFHFKHQQLAGKVYYSTGILCDARRLKELKKIILFFGSGKNRKFVIADILKILKFDKKSSQPGSCIPSDSAIWSVKKYANIDENTWFLIEALRILSPEEVNTFQVVYYENESVTIKKLEEVIEASTRINRVYCSQIDNKKEKLEEQFLLV